MTKLACGLRAVVGVAMILTACGGEQKTTPPATAPAVPSASVAPPAARSAAAPSAASSAAPAASSAAAPAIPPASKTKITLFSRNAIFGKVDKIGTGDGAHKADGVKDLVFDLEIDGAATAIVVASTDGQGQPNGEFTADTFVGTETLPVEVAGNLNQGKFTAGVGVFEGDKLLNGKDGAVSIPEGKHKLTLYVSSKDAPKTSAYKALVVTPDKALVVSPVAPAGK